MNWLDIVLVVFLIISVLVGLKNGLINTLFALVGLIGGIALAGRFYTQLAKILVFIPPDRAAQIVAFIIIFLAVAVVAFLLGKMLTAMLSAVMLGCLNRIGGAVFGLLLGAVVLGAILAITVKLWSGNGVIENSTIARVLLDRFPLVLSLLPSEFDSVRNFFKK
jgi:membrane protein required for colicin V production